MSSFPMGVFYPEKEFIVISKIYRENMYTLKCRLIAVSTDSGSVLSTGNELNVLSGRRKKGVISLLYLIGYGNKK